MPKQLLPNRDLPWPIVWPGVVMIAMKESCRLRAYLCPAGKWTCGWGETSGVGPNTVWTQDYADQRFCDSLTLFTDEVRAACTVEPNENEFAAMVSLAYNIGLGWRGKAKPKGARDGFRQSTVLRQHNLGNKENASRAFGLWNKANGQVMNGLVARRAEEAALYLTPPEGAEPAPMPQAVEPESKPIAGPIASGGALVTASGAVGVFNALGDQVSAIKTTLSTFRSVAADIIGVPPDWIFPLMLVIVGGVILRYRYKQRSTGHA